MVPVFIAVFTTHAACIHVSWWRYSCLLVSVFMSAGVCIHVCWCVYSWLMVLVLITHGACFHDSWCLYSWLMVRLFMNFGACIRDFRCRYSLLLVPVFITSGACIHVSWRQQFQHPAVLPTLSRECLCQECQWCAITCYWSTLTQLSTVQYPARLYGNTLGLCIHTYSRPHNVYMPEKQASFLLIYKWKNKVVNLIRPKNIGTASWNEMNYRHGNAMLRKLNKTRYI